MTIRPQITATSGLLPHQIAALGPQQADAGKSFRLANATYRAIRAAGVLYLALRTSGWKRRALVRLAERWS